MHVKLGFVEMMLGEIEEHVGGVCEGWVGTETACMMKYLRGTWFLRILKFIHGYIRRGDVRSAREV
ncbi:hypothetical protein Syun_004876 [Stephania yunnanensis]|uniref:Uncharacterized protein n=1 Tax=Stephania yunnanensis TaxID=152371 RepID=A0AAP0Q2Y3_9MAGN